MKDRIRKLLQDKKRILIIIGVCIVICSVILILYFVNKKDNLEVQEEVPDFYDTLYEEEVEEDDFVYDPSLPKPEITTGSRGELGIDKNINEKTIDNYLGRSDSVYRDMRMLIDPANYENIGGNRYLNGYIKGFEIVPLTYIIPVKGLPSEVGNTYTGETLFHMAGSKYIANYKESLKIIEKLFPKNKYIFLMCGGGGYANIMKNFLVSMGWKSDRIYNVGGYWYYQGDNSINTVDGVGAGGVDYNFDDVPYHNIDFSRLTKSEDYVLPDYGVESVELSTSNVKVEVGMSFQLNTIVLPNEAPNKAVKWTSDDPSIATVSSTGLVKGIKKGSTTIRVKTKDGNKEASANVLVIGFNGKDKVVLDDISEELKLFEENDPEKYESEFHQKEMELQSQGRAYNADGRASAEWHQIYEESEEKKEAALKVRVDTFNRLLQENKTFIVLINSKDCGSEDYRIIDGAEKVLKDNNVPHFYTYDPASGVDTSLFDSNINQDDLNSAAAVIIKNGSVYAAILRDYDSIKSDAEVKSWFSRYIEI